MATRDQSQGVGFVQATAKSNVYELFKKAAQASSLIQNSRVLRGEDLGKVQIFKYTPPT